MQQRLSDGIQGCVHPATSLLVQETYLASSFSAGVMLHTAAAVVVGIVLLGLVGTRAI
jgi:hypothetical protein